MIKLIIKRQKSNTKNTFQEPTELIWIGCLIGLNLDPKIQIRHIDTKHQLADMMTKGNFTRDEWNNLVHLFNISHSALKRWRRGCKRTTKRRQDCCKIKAHSNEPDVNCLDKFLIRETSDCVEKPGDTQSIYWETWREGKKKFKTRRSVEFSRKAARCIPWRVDGRSSGEACRHR